MAGILPSSPRTRRRLLVAGLLVVAAGAAGLVIALLPNDHGGIASSEHTDTVQLVQRQRQILVTAQMRSSIDALFDHFVPLAMARRNPPAARPFVTPALWRQATQAEWRQGTIPVPPYEAAGTTFHGWRTIYAFPREASVELVLEPKRRGDPVGSFVVDLERIGPRWLVDGIYSRGTRGGGQAATPATTLAQTTTERPTRGLHGQLGFLWILVPLALLSLIVIVPLIVFTRQWWSERRVKRRHRAELSKELPPLPRPRQEE